MKEIPEGAVCGADGCTPADMALAEASLAQALDIAIVSDVICPWCYVGKRRFENALASIGAASRVRVTWHPFELNPQMPKGGMERREYRMRKFGSLERSHQLDAQIAAAGAREGIAFRFDRVTRTPNTFDAHRLIGRAGHLGIQDRLQEALFRAYFTDGRDVGEAGVLADLAVECGMDRAEVLAFLSGNEGAAEVRAEEAAAHRAGVTGVPAFFANGRPLFAGAQPVPVVAEALSGLLLQTAD
jgi:predicted DsbA family dithiol-disulfide isomerase